MKMPPVCLHCIEAFGSYKPTEYSANFCMQNDLVQVREGRLEKGYKRLISPYN
jgi:hypothetical protein